MLESKPQEDFVQFTFVVGHSVFPQGSAVKSAYDNLALVAALESKYGVIIKVDVNLASELAIEFMRGILVGRSLFDDIDGVISSIRRHYLGINTNALIAAVKDLQRVFLARYPTPPGC